MNTDITFEDEEIQDEDSSLIGIITNQLNVIYYLSDIELVGLYDAFNEDKIKCIVQSFKTIDLAQKSLQKKIKSNKE